MPLHAAFVSACSHPLPCTRAQHCCHAAGKSLCTQLRAPHLPLNPRSAPPLTHAPTPAVQAAGLKDVTEWDGIEALSMACPALPLCGLAIGEAERTLVSGGSTAQLQCVHMLPNCCVRVAATAAAQLPGHWPGLPCRHPVQFHRQQQRTHPQGHKLALSPLLLLRLFLNDLPIACSIAARHQRAHPQGHGQRGPAQVGQVCGAHDR